MFTLTSKRIYVSNTLVDGSKMREFIRKHHGIVVADPSNVDIAVCDFSKGEVDELIQLGAKYVYGPPVLYESASLNSPLPLHPRVALSRSLEGLVFCPTGMETNLRHVLKARIERMCGQFTGDLTSDVTHLVCQETGSEKYKVAIKNNKIAVKPSWINFCFEKRERVDIKKHLYPRLKNCVICVTQVPPPVRLAVQKLSTALGGRYSGMLTKNVTHLIAEIQSGAKYEQAMMWKNAGSGIHVVGVDWFADTVRGAGRMDELEYLPGPASNSDWIPKDNSMRKSPERMNFMSKTKEDTYTVKNTNTNSTSRPAENSEYPEFELGADLGGMMNDVPMDNLVLDGCKIYLYELSSSESSEVMKSLRSCGASFCPGFSTSVTHVVTSPNMSKSELSSKFPLIPCVTLYWVFACEKQMKKLPIDGYDPWNRPSKRKNILENHPLNNDDHDTEVEMIMQGDSAKRSKIQHSSFEDSFGSHPPIFRSTFFAFHEKLSEQEKATLQQMIDERDGTVVPSLEKMSSSGARYFIVAHGTPPCEWHGLTPWSSSGQSIAIVSPDYIKACARTQRLIHPRSLSILYAPLPHTQPRPEFACIQMCVSGYYYDLYNDINALAECMGCTVSPRLTRKNSHLLCRTAVGSKYDKAMEWGMQVVSIEWLIQTALHGSVQHPIVYPPPHEGPPPGSFTDSDDGCLDWPSNMKTFYNLNESTSPKKLNVSPLSSANTTNRAATSATLPRRTSQYDDMASSFHASAVAIDSNGTSNRRIEARRSKLKEMELINDAEAVEHREDGTQLSYQGGGEAERMKMVTKWAKKTKNNKPHFIMSREGMVSDLKPKVKQIVHDLGGVLDTDFAVGQSTHLINGIPAYTGKTLSALYAGIWVLVPEYIGACAEANEFLDEAEYEWSNEWLRKKADQMDPAAVETAETIVHLFSYWRKKIQQQSSLGLTTGALHGKNFILCVNTPRKTSYKQVILAGGGKIVDDSPPYCNILSRNRDKNIDFAMVEIQTNERDLMDCIKARQADHEDVQYHSTLDGIRTEPVVWISPEFLKTFISGTPHPTHLPPKILGSLKPVSRTGQCDCR